MLKGILAFGLTRRAIIVLGLLVFIGALIRVGHLGVDGSERHVFELIKAEFRIGCIEAGAGARADQANVRGERRVYRTGQHEHDVRTQAAHGLGETVAGGTQATADERREFPAEHEDAHNPATLSQSRQNKRLKTMGGKPGESKTGQSSPTAQRITRLQCYSPSCQQCEQSVEIFPEWKSGKHRL